jgi:hypothetical protein
MGCLSQSATHDKTQLMIAWLLQPPQGPKEQLQDLLFPCNTLQGCDW